MKSHAEVYEAYRALLAQPDPPDLPTRARRYTQPGKVEKDAIRVGLERAYLRHRHQAAGREDGEIVSVRRTRLRLVARERTA